MVALCCDAAPIADLCASCSEKPMPDDREAGHYGHWLIALICRGLEAKLRVSERYRPITMKKFILSRSSTQKTQLLGVASVIGGLPRLERPARHHFIDWNCFDSLCWIVRRLAGNRWPRKLTGATLQPFVGATGKSLWALSGLLHRPTVSRSAN